jgi:hypothetical protein
MATLIPQTDSMFTPFEPKVQNRFILRDTGGIPAFIVKKVNRPQMECGEVVLNHINVQQKFKGICKWGDITMTLYDPIVPSGAQKVMEWVRTAHESTTGRDGYAQFYKRNLTIDVLGPVGDEVERWKLWGAFIKTSNFGDMDWATETQIELQLTLAIDYAVLEY